MFPPIRPALDVRTSEKARLPLGLEGSDGRDVGEVLDGATPGDVVHRLAEALDGPLHRLPSGGLSIVGQAVHRPSPDAWLIARRGEIADLCRYGMELKYARSTGREELAARLTAYVDMLAGDLLHEISP